MARAHGSYPWCHWFKSSCRYQCFKLQIISLWLRGMFLSVRAKLRRNNCFISRNLNADRQKLATQEQGSYLQLETYGPLVKRLRLRPFTPATRVRVPYGSPNTFKGELRQSFRLLEFFLLFMAVSISSLVTQISPSEYLRHISILSSYTWTLNRNVSMSFCTPAVREHCLLIKFLLTSNGYSSAR